MVQLPTQRTEVDRRWISQKIGLIGQGGVGKSTLAACDPTALFLDTDHNLTHLRVFKVPIWSWNDFREAYVQLAELAAKKDVAFPYSTIVVDTADKLLEYAEEDTIQRAREKYKKDDIFTLADILDGRKGWSDASKTFLMGLDKLAALPTALILISHVKSVRVEEPLQKYDKEAVSLWGQVGVKTSYFLSHILQIQAYHKGEHLVRKVYTLPSKAMDAKSHGGVIPNGWEMAMEMMVNWVAIRRLFQPSVDDLGYPIVEEKKVAHVEANR